MNEQNEVVLIGSLTRVDGRFDRSGALTAWGWVQVPHPRADKYTKISWRGDDLDASCLEWQGRRCKVIGGLYWVPREEDDGFDLRVYATSIELVEQPRERQNGSGARNGGNGARRSDGNGGRNGGNGRSARPAARPVRARPAAADEELSEEDMPF